MITIGQLLESVDLNFEPRWITKDEDGTVIIWEKEPRELNCSWGGNGPTLFAVYDCLKLSEFDGKDWTECIYEVPHNDIDYEQIKLDMEETIKQLDKLSTKLDTIRELMTKKGLIKVDAVNELKANKGAKNG